MAGYHVENFGCRASRADGEAIAAGLRARGIDGAASPTEATVVIVNTCSVTAEADRTARSFLRRIERTNPEARVIVTGCYAQRAPEEIASMRGVDAVIGNSHKSMVPKIAASLATAHDGHGSTSAGFVPLASIGSAGQAATFVDRAFAHTDLAWLSFSPGSEQTRPNLKVQDGCGNRCSFCVIPTTRGPSRSVSLEECLRAVEEFATSGGKELVLSGINLGRWGRDLQPAMRFEDLVAAILEQTSLPRLRISSVEPMDWSDALLALFRQYGRDVEPHGPRLARHAHLPLQSGSDAVLRRMHRRYRPWHYAERLAAIRDIMPEAAIGADVIAGFPGETAAEFDETCEFLRAHPFTYLHIFPFSARPGTPAWALAQQQPVPAQTLQERLRILRLLAAEKHLQFRRQFLGRELSAISLERREEHQGAAISDNFLKLEIPGPLAANRSLRVRITGIGHETLIAETRVADTLTTAP